MINILHQAAGWAVFSIAAVILLLLWWVHVWAIMKDIAHDDAKELADEMFENYIENCEYRVRIGMRIVDEMHTERGGRK